MGKLASSVSLPSVEDVISGKSTWDKFWRDFLSSLVHYLQKIINRLNDEVVGNTGSQTIDGELYISQKFGVGTTTRITRIASGVVSLTLGTIPANGGQVEASVTLTGTADGDEVHATPKTGLENNLVWNAYVSAPDTVKVRVVNPTAAGIAAAVRDWLISTYRYI